MKQKQFANKIEKLLTSRRAIRGNTAMIFALCSVAIVSVLGGAVDFARASSDRARAQALLDSAILAPFSNETYYEETTQVQAIVTDYLGKNSTGLNGSIQNAVVTRTKTGYQADATFKSTPFFLQIIGIKEIPQKILSAVAVNEVDLEIAFVLDTSGSMTGAKIAALKEAMQSTLDQIGTWGERFRSYNISIVPFANNVNVGAIAQTESWMDTAAISPAHQQGFFAPINRFDLFSHLGSTWEGCVDTRAAPYDVTDEPATSSNPASLFVPWFAQDEPDQPSAYPNSYLQDSPVGSAVQVARDIGKYGANSGPRSGWAPPNAAFAPYSFYSGYSDPPGPNFMCNSAPIIPLTSDIGSLSAKVASLNALGGTNLAEGLLWGWRTLSPAPPYTTGQPSSRSVRKILVFMTDGNNQHNVLANALGSERTSSGYLLDGAFGGSLSTTQSVLNNAMDDRTLQVCTNIKKDNIRVYTIRLGLNDARSEAVLKGCASSADDFFDSPQPEQLKAAFEKVTRGLMQLYLSN
jgi:Flp pilus assembly protein TadG